MRRRLLPALLLPALLLAVALAATTMALAAVPPPSGPPASASGPPAAAPVLTVRRVPVLLATPFGERRLADGLRALTGDLPEPSCLEVGEGERTLFESATTTPVIPASLLKIVTAVTVLTHLGPSTTLATTVQAAAAPVDGVVPGDLWLVGGGDPLLGTAEWGDRSDLQPELRTSLEALADRVAAAGVRTVEGSVAGDESRFDDARVVASWPDRYRTSNQVGPLSALTVNDGFGGAGGRLVAFADPAQGAAAVFNELLRQRGVEVRGDPVRGTTPDGAVTLAAVDSAPTLELVGQMLRDSDNGTAELLLKEVGRAVAGEGSTSAGAGVAEATLAAMSLPTDGVDVVDGSGLDRGNRLTCRLLTELLAQVEAGDVEGGLAVAGVTGTLAERFLDTPVSGRLRAKTGTLSGVAALAGYADTRNEGELTFALVENGGDAGAAAARQAELAALLVAYPDAPDIEELGPAAWPGLAAP